MPKTTADVPKSLRILTVLEVLRDGGSLRTAEVRRRVAERLQVEDPQVLAQGVLRDLRDLLAHGRVVQDFFLPSGEQIEEEERDRYRTVESEWSIAGSLREVRGLVSLEKRGVTLLCSRSFSHSLQVLPGREFLASERVGMILDVQGERWGIGVRPEDLPWTLVVSRTLGIPFQRKSQDVLEREFGRRTVLLQLLADSISAYRGEGDLGHFAVTFERDGRTFRVQDLDSKNGTELFSLPLHFSLDRVFQEQAEVSRTITLGWGEKIQTQTKYLGPARVQDRFQNPVLVVASRKFPFLLLAGRAQGPGAKDAKSKASGE